MYELDFNTPAKIHFTGIGGISMSGLAEIMLSKGFTVTGSDSRESEITNLLEQLFTMARRLLMWLPIQKF